MPPGFELPTAEVQLWQPLPFSDPQWLDERTRGRDSLVVLGRMRPSATITSARAEMDAIAARLRDQYPASNAAFGVMTDPLTDRVIGQTTTRSLWLLFGSVGFVLLIACANVANLVLARSARRRNEFSLRTALGASRIRLVRQALTENLVLSLLAGTVGLLFAWGGTVALRRLAPGALPRADTISADATVLLFLLAVSLASGLIAGLLPALQLSSTRPADVLRENGPRALGGRGGRRLHQGLVVAEIALAVMLLRARASSSAASSASRRRTGDSIPATCCSCKSTFQAPTTTSRSARVLHRGHGRVRTLPGVLAVGAVSDFFIHRQPDYHVALEGQPAKREEDPAHPLTEDQVVPGYFEAMRIPLLRGRLLQESDLAQGAPQVIVINEEMARRFWPDQDPSVSA